MQWQCTAYRPITGLHKQTQASPFASLSSGGLNLIHFYFPLLPTLLPTYLPTYSPTYLIHCHGLHLPQRPPCPLPPTPPGRQGPGRMYVHYFILCTLSKSHPFVPDVWVDGNGGLRSKTTVCLALLRVFPCVLIFLCQDRQQEGD